MQARLRCSAGTQASNSAGNSTAAHQHEPLYAAVVQSWQSLAPPHNGQRARSFFVGGETEVLVALVMRAGQNLPQLRTPLRFAPRTPRQEAAEQRERPRRWFGHDGDGVYVRLTAQDLQSQKAGGGQRHTLIASVHCPGEIEARAPARPGVKRLYSGQIFAREIRRRQRGIHWDKWITAGIGRIQAVHHGCQQGIQRVERRAVSAHRYTHSAGAAGEKGAVRHGSIAEVFIETRVPEDDKVQAERIRSSVLNGRVELQRHGTARAQPDNVTGEVRRIEWVGVLVTEKSRGRAERRVWIVDR